MNKTAIEATGLWKRYDIHPIHSLFGKGVDFVNRLSGRRAPKEPFWALRDVDFEVKRGETLGIIGHNGAGKSTLLKLLCGVTAATKGSLRVDGRVAPLIEMGAGFHPELTGRENVFINGVILGMSRREVRKKYQQIVDFAEIGEFMDTPVKKYSSGMFVRLGFSIAVHVDPEVLLIDEILSVGDLGFQNKSLRRLAELREQAQAVVFVSHNIAHVTSICDRVILLGKGRIVASGSPHEVVEEYRQMMEDSAARSRLGSVPSWRTGLKHISSGQIDIKRIAILDAGGHTTDVLPDGADLRVEVEIDAHEPVASARFAFGLVNQAGIICMHLQSERDGFTSTLPAGPGRVQVSIPTPRLAAGRYSINFSVYNAETGETCERFHEAAHFRVAGEKHGEAVLACRGEWQFRPEVS